MNPLTRLLRPLGNAARVFFQHDVALRRGEQGLQLVLEQRGMATRPETPAEAAARKEHELLALMQGELAALLDELPQARQARSPLALFAAALARKGLRALEQVPLVSLQQALEQLEGLVTNWSPVGLATLRSKMAVAVSARQQLSGPAGEGNASDTRSEAEDSELDAAPSQPLVMEAEPDVAAEALAAAYAALGAAAPTPADPTAVDRPPAVVAARALVD